MAALHIHFVQVQDQRWERKQSCLTYSKLFLALESDVVTRTDESPTIGNVVAGVVDAVKNDVVIGASLALW